MSMFYFQFTIPIERQRRNIIYHLPLVIELWVLSYFVVGRYSKVKFTLSVDFIFSLVYNSSLNMCVNVAHRANMSVSTFSCFAFCVFCYLLSIVFPLSLFRPLVGI